MAISTHQSIAQALAKNYNALISREQAELEISKLTPVQLSEFVVDAFHRGVLTREFLGFNEDGEML